MWSQESVMITLGDMPFRVRPLTFGQVVAIEKIVMDRTPKQSAEHGLEILGVALSRDYKTTVVADLESNLPQITEAVTAVLRHGGFLSGEAAAAARDAPTGDGSEAA